MKYQIMKILCVLGVVFYGCISLANTPPVTINIPNSLYRSVDMSLCEHPRPTGAFSSSYWDRLCSHSGKHDSSQVVPKYPKNFFTPSYNELIPDEMEE